MKTYTGSCHCGNVRFEATMDIDKVLDCNCSNCGKRGLLLKFIPETQFKLLSGEESLKEYRFNKKHIAHMICTNCGLEPFGKGQSPDGSTMVAVNVQCLDGDVDPDSFPVEKFNGKAL